MLTNRINGHFARSLLKLRHKPLYAALLAASMCLAPQVQAQDSLPESLSQSIRQAIENNPEVQARWHEFQALDDGLSASRSGYLPRIDITARTGRNDRNYGNNDAFSSSDAEISLIQNLFNGFRTRGEVSQASEQKLVGYYTFMEQLESTALEAIAAYQDVLRQRELVQLAEDNLRQHERVFEQISDSAAAGVARSVDLEQISGRLSLAEANLITEQSNLHDVSARYQRITGDVPPGSLPAAPLQAEQLPQTLEQALSNALVHNPGYLAASRNIAVADAEISIRKANLSPSLDLALRQNYQSHDELGNRDNRNEAQIGLEFRYNLYSGGRDMANIRGAHDEANAARDLRNKACTDLRQTLQIAFNDVNKIDLQLTALNQHRLSSSRVRTAYKQQFDIGQRTLLDVLDAENEYFQASRAYANAVYDREIAIARTLEAQGQLLSTLGIVRTGLPDLGSETEAQQNQPGSCLSNSQSLAQR
ncbi:MAG: hypothetical protein CVV07_11420 [Gammaproteobacteria bacterium HGW-Gammaproteobacteria-11]|nr:MAG: hypothetical protein CVV07_11420 [Gammaproteobacteria bacterium HGW-Gammaproteobacteria-11]